MQSFVLYIMQMYLCSSFSYKKLKFMRNLFYTLFFLMIFAGFSVSAQSISGKITDAKSNEALPGATVSIDGTSLATMTDPDGVFKLDVQAGTWTVKFSYVGYLENQLEIYLGSGESKDLGTIALESEVVGLDELLVVASFARDRQTPVAFSDVKPEMILEKLGTQEFPEILKSTPGVYATKAGGGYGDGRINLRGFDSNNIGVLINGVPVNDMENGKVYWSNWAGLSDVTRSMQVQRGLGASRLAISSIGGTINIITKSTDAKQGGSVSYAVGNDGYSKETFTFSTGMTDKGWAITASGAHTKGDGYINGTDFEGWSYFLNLAKRFNAKHQLAYTVFGAPQWHHQRSSMHLIKDYLNHPDRTKFNSDYGYRDGQLYGGSYAYNIYHKPQMSLNHTWTLNKSTSLNTSAYASLAKGGGRQILGPQRDLLRFGYPNGAPTATTMLTNEGHLDYSSVIDINRASLTGAQAIVATAINSHDWYGVLSTVNTQFGNIMFTGGLDGRFYRGYHFTEIEDLLGGAYYLDATNKNRDAGTPLQKGDKISYYNLIDVAWVGAFAQAEYVSDMFSAFVTLAGSQTNYRRIDFFQYTNEADQTTEWVPFIGYSAKAGANYNINKNHNLFVNGGYFTRAPFANTVFVNYTNTINADANPQRVLSSEVGYGFSSSIAKATLAAYRTAWLDKTLTRSMGGDIANITGLNAVHQGIEAEITLKPTKRMDVKIMASVGDWRWQNDVEAALYNADQVFVDSLHIYAKDIHVADAAQTTGALGLDYEILPRFKIGADYNYYDRLFAQFNIEDRAKPELAGVDAWQLPAYHLFDLNMSYKFKIGKTDAAVYGKVNNVLDIEYIADARDNTQYTSEVIYGSELNSPVFFGFGRTWSLTLKLNF